MSEKQLLHRGYGQFMIISGALLFSVCNGFLKSILDEGVSKWTIFFLRGNVTVLINLMIVFFLRGSEGVMRTLRGVAEPEETLDESQLKGVHYPGYYVYLRGVFAVASSSILISVYESYMSFADSFAIFLGLLTISSNVLATVALGEQVRRTTVIGAIICICGIFMTVQPEFLFGPRKDSKEDASGQSEPTFFGLVLLVIASTCNAMSTLCTRVLSSRSPQTLLQGFMAVLAVQGLLSLTVFGRSSVFPHSLWQITSACMYISGTIIGQYCVAAGFRYEQVSIGSVLTNTEIAFAFLVDAIFLHETITSFELSGATAVFIGGAIVALGSRDKPATAPTPDASEKTEARLSAVVVTPKT